MHNSQYVLHANTPDIVLSSVFKKYDKDKSGELDINEFARAVSDLGVIDEQEQEAIFRLADADNGGTICIDEFIKLIKGNEFDHILASHDSLQFIYETYKTFQQFDADQNHEISWDEFYFYLSKHGYTHQQISQHWYFLDTDKNSKVTFDEFWKGYKAMAEAQKEQIQKQQQYEDDIDEEEQKMLINETNKKKKKKSSKIIKHEKHLIFNNKDDENNILNATKNKLKRSSHKMKESVYKAKVGKVVEDENANQNEPDDKNKKKGGDGQEDNNDH